MALYTPEVVEPSRIDRSESPPRVEVPRAYNMAVDLLHRHVLEGRGVTVLIKGARPEHLRVLEAVGALERLAHVNHLFTDLDAALAHAHVHNQRAHRARAAV